MQGIDAGILWPKLQDFPLFRHNLGKIREYFNTVNIYFTDNYSGKQIDDFVKDSLKELNVNFLYAERPLIASDDWADCAFKQILSQTQSKWFLSIHPDIFFKDWEKLFITLEELRDEYDLIGNPYGEKSISPSFLLIKRADLFKTCLDIRAHSGFDHWGLISKDMQNMGKRIMTLSEIGFEPGKDYLHLSGVSQDFENGLLPDYVFPDPKKFYSYIHWSLKTPVEFDPSWVITARLLETSLKSLLPDFNPEESPLTEFLKI